MRTTSRARATSASVRSWSSYAVRSSSGVTADTLGRGSLIFPLLSAESTARSGDRTAHFPRAPSGDRAPADRRLSRRAAAGCPDGVLRGRPSGRRRDALPAAPHRRARPDGHRHRRRRARPGDRRLVVRRASARTTSPARGPRGLPGEVHVAGFSGSGFSAHASMCGRVSFHDRAPTALAARPSLVVVEGGLNDYDQPAAAIDRGFRDLMADLAGQRVVVVGPADAPVAARARSRASTPCLARLARGVRRPLRPYERPRPRLPRRPPPPRPPPATASSATPSPTASQR